MGDIFREIDEDLRRDRLQEVWKRYGTYILTGAGVIIVATAGWVAWQEYQQRNNVATTAALHSAMSAARSGNTDAAIAAFAEVSQDGSTGQAALALLQEAALRADTGDRDNARVLYRNIIDNRSLDAPYRALATIRMVELDLADGDPGQLLNLLQPLTADDSPWRLTAWELAAYLERRSGDADAARSYLQQILDDGDSTASARARAEAFLAQL